ncbi:MAG TPA: TIGR04552 family protein [Holophagaceae bacterium]|nr:TIGR04552 family protein [Holophagaceae bacterium]
MTLTAMRHHPPFPLPAEVTKVILGGGSSIDLEGLQCSSHDEAWDFAFNYGYDMRIPAQRHHVVRVFEDALTFLQGVILEGTDLTMPGFLTELEDPLDLLVWASERADDGTRGERAIWSCAVLRVMHTLFHIDHNVNLRFLPEIQKQVFERYDRYLVQENGQWLLRGGYEVPLAAVERKENKDRNSMLLKLLHKPENVAETIYDQIGIRLVAEDQLGVLLVIRFLLDHHVLMSTHIKPSRSRNLLIDLKALDAWMLSLPEPFQIGELTPEERRDLSHTLSLKGAGTEANPFSAKDYSAIQFTARTLIRLPNPATLALESVLRRMEITGISALADQMHITELIQKQEEFTFFFAHEVQVMERSGFENAQSGPASHAEYKQRQRDAARRRVLQGLL